MRRLLRRFRLFTMNNIGAASVAGAGTNSLDFSDANNSMYLALLNRIF